MKKTVLFIFGTRPEAIKLAPLIVQMKGDDAFQSLVCVTGQHRQMLDPILEFFQIKVDYDFNLMAVNQSLVDLSGRMLIVLGPLLQKVRPNFVVVQGDTTTAFLGALAAYYEKIAIVHIEAGLRSGNMFSPFPEEGNRVLLDQIANYYFVPTAVARENLHREGKTERVYEVGNTVVDALLYGVHLIEGQGEDQYAKAFAQVRLDKKIILVTAHRRESFGEQFKNICIALKRLAENFRDVEIIYPVHLNPNVQKPVQEILNGIKNVHLVEPQGYPQLLWLMKKSYFVITDSGGIQEEAPSLGKPVLVMRDVTERVEGIHAGSAKLVGTGPERIFQAASELLTSTTAYQKMQPVQNPYGDGRACERIISILKAE